MPDPPAPSPSPSPLPLPNRIVKDVVVLGGGFTGVFCAKRLASALRRAGLPPENALLVSDQNYMVFQPMLAEVAGGSLSPRHVVNPLRRLCREVSVLRGRVESIDLARRDVRVDTGSFSSGALIEFKHLVVALGAEIDLSRVPGMPEHALVMQNVGDAMILRATIISRVEEAHIEQREEVRRRLLTFVVVGGGYSGVETAGEILDLLKSVAKYYPTILREELRVVLVHSRERVLHNLGENLGEYAGSKLAQRGLELRLGERVRAVTATRVYLESGEVIESATVLSTVGTAPHRVVRDLCEHSDLPHRDFRLVTDEFLRVEGCDFVWAAGDCASVPLAGPGEGRCPQTAQFAMRQGQRLADNLGLALRGRPMKPFTFRGLGEMASIGHRSAVASIRGLRFSGLLAWFLWRTVYLSKLPGLDRKLRVVIEWTLDLFFPRDINLLNPRYTKLFKRVHLEPGDKLFNRGEPSFSLYVVQSGRIDLVDGGGRVVRTVEEGDFFGERALLHGGGYLYDAVSHDRTELVSLSGEVVMPFLLSSRSFRRVLAKTTAQGSAEAELAAVAEKLDPGLLEKPVDEMMRRDVARLRPDQTVREALDLFRRRRFSVYPLVDEEGKTCGALSREDFFHFLKRDDAGADAPLSRVERMNLPVCQNGTTVSEALERMVRSGQQKCLVADADSHLLGIFTAMDLLGAAVEEEV